ncbi:pitrilysin family protein [Pseudoxanthomonas putridarboris]|uniref:Pitrilysin family protein n=1 Tax=Pseudoxanthomonas putridarboris TaxID=752605 RepID=A0ABU9IVP5_9GAMM
MNYTARTGMPSIRRICGVSLVVLACLALSDADAASSPVSPAQRELALEASSFKLENGLTVVVHEDHSAPLVHVNLWYHVGSKNEPEGKSGFAHLFEHLMFNGSENFNDDFFKATQRIGASSQNGTTNVDRTNYFQTVPKAALDSILWLESDRMGHLLGAIDQAKLDEQRSVVKNEKRQGDNKPYALSSDLIMRAMMPVGHPYAHSTIGSMDDLDAASLDDVHAWFRTYYGPSNAVLVLSGDITVAEAKDKAKKYFGDIAPGVPVSHPTSWVARKTGTVREVAYDRVAQPRIYRVWNTAEYASPDNDYLQLFGQLLSGDKNSRLYKRLVIDEQLATGVSASVWGRVLGGQFSVAADVKPGGDIRRVEKVISEELARLLSEGPSAAELNRVRAATTASFIRSMESLSAKAGLLAESQTYLDDANAWKAGYDRYLAATPAQVRDAGRNWLSDGDYVLHILPFGDLKAAKEGADRKAMPMPTSVVPASFPIVERATLDNGMKLVVARRRGVPLANMTMALKTGVPKDFASIKSGTGALTMALLDEGTKRLNSEQLVDALASLGATLQAGGGGETSQVSMSALKQNLVKSLDLYADVIMNPAFAQADIDRLKGQTRAGISATKQDPSKMASRLSSRLLFGPDHAYGRLMSEADADALTRNDVAQFHARWFHPNNATLVVTGDTDLAEIRPLIEAAFANWKEGALDETLVPTSDGPQEAVVYLIDKPGTPQTVIRAAMVAPARKEGDAIARDAMNTVLGGSFTSRLNMKLREEKGWAYGARSSIGGGNGSQVFSASASVQADKTAESMTEIAKALSEITGARPVTVEELAVARDDMSLGLTSAWATSGGIASYLVDQEVAGLPEDYYATYPRKVTDISLDAIDQEAQNLLGKRPLTWVVVGDRSKIEAQIRALKLGEIRVIDADGNPAR